MTDLVDFISEKYHKLCEYQKTTETKGKIIEKPKRLFTKVQ